MCKCVNITSGSYNRQIWMHAPSHMPKDNGYCIDLCIAQEISQLWMAGVTTTGCCCGHNTTDGYIGVVWSDIQAMLELGYQPQAHPYGETGYFTPKYDRLL